MSIEPLLIKRADAAKLLGVSTRTLDRMVEEVGLDDPLPRVVLHKACMFPAADLRAWIVRRSLAATAAAASECTRATMANTLIEFYRRRNQNMKDAVVTLTVEELKQRGTYRADRHQAKK